MRTFFILCVFLVMAAPSRAAIIYVDADAPGSVHDGTTWATAYVQIQDALNTMRGGGELWVAAGSYMSVSVGSSSSVELYGGFAGDETRRDERDPSHNVTVVSGERRAWAMTFGAPGTVDGFTFRAGATGGFSHGAGVAFTTVFSHNVVSGGLYGIGSSNGMLIATDNHITGATVGIMGDVKSGADIRRNVITECGAGISYPEAWPLAVIRDNAISGSQLGMFLGGSVLAANNTVVKNGAGIQLSEYITYFPQDAGVYLANNIVAFNAGAGIAGHPALSHNNVYANAPNYADRAPDPTDLSVNPLFADLARGDFHIQPASPMRNRGDGSVTQAGETDTDGQPRVLDGAVDIGADESDGTVWPVAPENIVRVKPGGNDAADGRTWEAAKATIQAAVDAAPAGEVWIAAGEYKQPVQLTWGASLYGGFKGDETARSQSNPATNVTTLSVTGADAITAGPTAVGSTVDGFTLLCDAAAIRAFSAQVTASRLNITAWAGVLASRSSVRLLDSRIRNNRGAAVSTGDCTLEMLRNRVDVGNTYSDYCVFVSGGTASLRNNVFNGNPGTDYPSSAGLKLRGAADLRNNTITAFRFTAVSIESPGVTLANNIVAFNGTGIANPYRYSVASSRNDVVCNNLATVNAGDYSPADTRGPTDVALDPRFANPRGGDLHIQPGSPTRDTGDNAFALPGDTDMDGQPRIQGGTVDIGADESDGTAYYPARLVVYVRPDGSDNASGQSWAAAVKTVQAAVSRATDADVWVAKGTYPGRVNLLRHANLYGGFAGTETARDQRDPAANVTVMDGTGLAGDTVTAAPSVFGAVVDGFTIRAGSGAAIQTAADLIIARNHLIGGIQGVSVSGGAPDIRQNVVEGGATGLYITGGAPMLHDNLVTGTAQVGVYSNAPVSLWNNTVVDNAGDGVVLQARSTRSNNIFAYNGGAGLTEWATGSGRTNLYFANAGGNYKGNIPYSTEPSTDPMFVDPDGGDYHPRPGSPAIDRGFDEVILLGERDLDGKPRILGAHVDVGAYEFGEAAPPGLADAATALRIAAGLHWSATWEAQRLNADPSDRAITLADALAILRMAGIAAD